MSDLSDLESRVERLEREVGLVDHGYRVVARAEYSDETIEIAVDDNDGLEGEDNVIHVLRDGEDLGMVYANILASKIEELYDFYHP